MPTPEKIPADVREMYLVHIFFRREFVRLPGLVQGVAPGDKKRAEFISDHIDLLGKALHAHHHSEDVHLWPKLLQRCPDELAPIVHVMADQHDAIKRTGNQVLAAVRPWRTDPGRVSGEALADALERLAGVLVKHMDAEEEQVLPLIEQYITEAEWQTMAAGAGEGIPEDKKALILGMMLYEGDPDVLEKTFSRMPPDLRERIEQQATNAYAEHAVTLYGTAAPPKHFP